ncbi:hypothetical protein [Saccharothrix syringae]|uniref:Uncharacterized protein n=1 Tax=Saccharothrix syringae TaxID=103733 RepID=A0A5Q0GYC4_SACSY|nr:hypothetical protein [Saccharothrix syringae]QFZ18938.1 hypothetical protein EKG83_17100 [Saccharothrix syringae]
MIRDLVLALLSAPLADTSAPARFAGGSPPRWRADLTRWLTAAGELDPDLDFDLAPHPAGLVLTTRRPVAATVVLALVTEPAAVPEVEADLLVVLACCPEWTGRCADDVLLLEPRWAAAVLLDHAAPLFWGVSAAERSPSVLDG